MDDDVLVVALRRGVWAWCFCSAASVAPAPFNLAAIPATVTGALGLSLGNSRRSYLSCGLTIGFGLCLYAASRLLFRNWHPLSVVLVTFAGAQTYFLAMRLLNKLGISSKVMWMQKNLVSRFYSWVWNCMVTEPPSKHPLVKFPLVVLGHTISAIMMAAITVLCTFGDFQHCVIPPIRMKLRKWQLKLRRWSGSSALAGWRTERTPQHRYQPLGSAAERASADNKPQMRLLKLLPRVPFGRIRCELFEVAVREIGEYQAVSYTWGAGERSGVIFVDGKSMSVSPNVEDLLYHLSSYFRSRFLWIDQVCINQADNDEKSSQIPLMGDIYRDADNTIVWLDDVEEPWKARSMLAAIWHEHMYGTTQSTLELMRSHAEESPLMGWAAMMNVFAHPWFSRVWVIQEIILSPRATVLASGEKIQWSHFEVFAELMLSSPFNTLLRSNDAYGFKDDACIGLGNAAKMAIFRRIFWNSSDYSIGGSLEYLLGIFANFQSTLPADRIYGLLALLSPEYRSAAHWLQPDYSKPPDEVFTIVATHLLHSDCNEILSLAGIGYDRNLPQLPSWVPDWTSLSVKDKWRMNFTQASHSSRYSASSSVPLSHYFPSLEVLSIKGHLFDTILHLSPVHTYAAHHKSEFAPTQQEKAAVIRPHLISRRMASQHIADPYPATGQPRDEAFWRTLIGDTESSRPANAEFGKYFRLWEIMLGYQSRDDPDMESDFAAGMEDLLSENDIKAQGQEPVPMLLRQVSFWNSNRIMCSTGRKFCVTKKGFMGMVPPGTREGDLLVILYGLYTPFVVRPVEGSERVRIVGEAYVHGMMDGEALSQLVGEVRMFEVE
ncbi:heterokaryon incompatibility protein-domain-containing protein [Cladorrhinum sp. PSN259]|nr:heterokaryon incompatibility protein-domain-containing protein [Cladorrhinum sp. PSN259]